MQQWGAPLPAVLQRPKGPSSSWGPLSEGWLFRSEGAAAAAAKGGDTEQQQQLLRRLKASPLLLVGEVGLLYSSNIAVHHLIAELSLQPGN